MAKPDNHEHDRKPLPVVKAAPKHSAVEDAILKDGPHLEPGEIPFVREEQLIRSAEMEAVGAEKWMKDHSIPPAE